MLRPLWLQISCAAYVKQYLLFVALPAAFFLTVAFRKASVPTAKITYTRFSSVQVPEPSDVVEDPQTGHLFMVSDGGMLYETDGAGTIIRKAADVGVDFEGVELKGDYLYVIDESPRKVHRYAKSTLLRDHTYSTPYSGARNSGFESIAWNEARHCFVLVVEKDPVTICEYSADFQLLNQYRFTAARDISSARGWNGAMYFLSDEDEAIFQCDPTTYAVQSKFNLNMLNPEGLAFAKDGRVMVAADDLQRLYYFPTLPAAHE